MGYQPLRDDPRDDGIRVVDPLSAVIAERERQGFDHVGRIGGPKGRGWIRHVGTLYRIGERSKNTVIEPAPVTPSRRRVPDVVPG